MRFGAAWKPGLAALALAGGAAMGCNASAPPVPQAGHYEGNLIRLQGGALAKFPVRAEVGALERGKAEIRITRIDGTADSTVELSEVSSDSMKVATPDLGGSPVSLKLTHGCYETRAAADVRFCPARDEIAIEATDAQSGAARFSLTLDWFPAQQPIELETPRVFTLDGAVAQAFQMEFNTRIEFDRVMQAQHLASNAYLNLLPHISINTILALADFTNIAGLVGTIGDLAPFLLPTRWLRAQQASLESEAEQDALILMRADAAEQVEGLAYAFDRDKQIRADYEAAIAQADDVQHQVAIGESLGQFPPGSADGLASVVDGMRTDLVALELLISEEKNTLSQALGMMNPLAVSDLVLSPSPGAVAVDAAADLDARALMPMALQRSFESRQVGFLIDAAKKGHTASFFDWLDPSGDPAHALGFGLGDAVDVEASKVAELQAKQQLVQSTVLQKVTDTVAEYNTAITQYRMANEDLETQNRRIQRTLELLRFGQGVSQLDLVTVFQDHLKTTIELRNAVATFDLNRAKLDRLLLQGYYARLSGQPGPTP